MFARVMSTDLAKEKIDEAAAEWRRHITPFRQAGMQQALMLVDRSTGKYLSITIWESEEVQRRNASSPGQATGRNAMTQKYFLATPTPATYEVVATVE